MAPADSIQRFKHMLYEPTGEFRAWPVYGPTPMQAAPHHGQMMRQLEWPSDAHEDWPNYAIGDAYIHPQTGKAHARTYKVIGDMNDQTREAQDRMAQWLSDQGYEVAPPGSYYDQRLGATTASWNDQGEWSWPQPTRPVEIPPVCPYCTLNGTTGETGCTCGYLRQLELQKAKQEGTTAKTAASTTRIMASELQPGQRVRIGNEWLPVVRVSRTSEGMMVVYDERGWYVLVEPSKVVSVRVAAKTAAGQVMYHFAPAARRDTIMREGLRPNMPDKDLKNPEGVYLWHDPDAYDHELDMAPRELYNGPGHPRKDMYEVNVAGLPVQPDTWYNEPIASYVPHAIPPDRLRRVSTHDISDYVKLGMGQAGDLPELRFVYDPTGGYEGDERHLFDTTTGQWNQLPPGGALSAYVGDEFVGHISLYPGGEIAMIEVEPKWQRRGIGTAMTQELDRRGVSWHHSDDRNEDADAWIDSTNDKTSMKLGAVPEGYEIRPMGDTGYFDHEEGKWRPRYYEVKDRNTGEMVRADRMQTSHGTGDGVVAYYGDDPVGSLTWQEEPHATMIGSAYVHPDHRQQGLFNAMYEYLPQGKPVDAYHWDNPMLRQKVRDRQRQASMKLGGMERYAEQVPINWLAPYIEFAREPGGEHFDRPGGSWESLRDDIAQNGIREPLIFEYDPDAGTGYVSEGSTRYSVAKELGLPSLPVLVLRSRERPGRPFVPVTQPGQYLIKDALPGGDFPQYITPAEIGIPTVGGTTARTAMAQPLSDLRARELTGHIEELAEQYGIGVSWTDNGQAGAWMHDIYTPIIYTDYDYLVGLHEIGHIAAFQADRGDTKGLGLEGQDWQWRTEHEPELSTRERDIEDEAWIWRWASMQSRIPVTPDMWNDAVRDAETYLNVEPDDEENLGEPWYTPEEVPNYPRTGPAWEWLQQQKPKESRTAMDWMGDSYPGEDHTEEKTIDKDWTQLQFTEDPKTKVEEHNWIMSGGYVKISDEDFESLMALMGHKDDWKPLAYGTVEAYYNYEMMFHLQKSNIATHLVEKGLKKYCQQNQLKFEGILSADGTFWEDQAKEASWERTADVPGVGRENPEKLWRIHYEDSQPVDYYGEQDPKIDNEPQGEMICPHCGEICDSYGDFLVHEERAHHDGLGIPDSPQPVVDLDDPMPAHFNTNPDTRTDMTINRQARRMPNFQRYAADIRALAQKTYDKLMERPDIQKLYEAYRNGVTPEESDAGEKWIHIHDVLKGLLQSAPESYKIWPWAVKQIKKNQLADAHFVDIVGQAGKLLHELRQNNRTPEGFDINQVATLPDLEDWLYNYRGQNAASEWEDAEHYMVFPDGWTIDKVKTDADLNREGDIMGHCVGGYCDVVSEGGSIIYSLRDPHEGSHATIEFGPPGKVISGSADRQGKLAQAIRQVQGKSNQKPIPEYIDRVKKFFYNYMHNEGIQLLDTGWNYDNGGELSIENGADVEKFWEIWKENPEALQKPSLKIVHGDSEWGGDIKEGEEVPPIEIYIADWPKLIQKCLDEFYAPEYQEDRRERYYHGESTTSGLDWDDMTKALYTLAWLDKEDPQKIQEQMYEVMNGMQEADASFNDPLYGWTGEDYEQYGIPLDDDGEPDFESEGYQRLQDEIYNGIVGNARHIPEYIGALPLAHGGWKETPYEPGTPPSQRFRALKHPHEWRGENQPLEFDYRNEPQVPRPEELITAQNARKLWDDYIQKREAEEGWRMDKTDPHYFGSRQASWEEDLNWRTYISAKMPLIPAPIPFIFDIESDKIHSGQPGHKHKDIKPKDKLTVNVVEGLYLPDGKLQFRTDSTMPYTVRYVIRMWYTLYPELEVKQVFKLVGDKKFKLANAKNIGGKVRDVAFTDQAAREAYSVLSNYGDLYVVGGAVRDICLGHLPKDIDLLVAGLMPEQVSTLLNTLPGRVDFTGQHFGVFRYKTEDGSEVEIALPRTEVSTGEGHKDFQVQTDAFLSIEEDLARRDFTGNAMAVNMRSGELIDPFNGQHDLSQDKLKLVNPKAFEDDPLRVLRAFSAMARQGLRPDEETKKEIEKNAYRLRALPAERIQFELDKIFGGKDPESAIRAMRDDGVLHYVMPEVAATIDFDQKNKNHRKVLDEHLLNVLRRVAEESNDPDLRLAALYHDVGKPHSQWLDDDGNGHYYKKIHRDELTNKPTGEETGANHEEVGAQMTHDFMTKMKYPNNRRDRVVHLVRNHMFNSFSDPRGAGKFLKNVGDEHGHDLLTLRRADQEGKGTDEWENQTPVSLQRQLIEQWTADQNATKVSDLAVNGNDLIAEGIPATSEMGRILNKLLEAVINDPSLNTKAFLLEMARNFHQMKDASVHKAEDDRPIDERLRERAMQQQIDKDMAYLNPNTPKPFEEGDRVNIPTDSSFPRVQEHGGKQGVINNVEYLQTYAPDKYPTQRWTPGGMEEIDPDETAQKEHWDKLHDWRVHVQFPDGSNGQFWPYELQGEMPGAPPEDWLRQSSILDPIRDSLDEAVFEHADADMPRLKPKIRHWIKKTIYKVLRDNNYPDPEEWTHLVLTGSLTTYQWSPSSDLDVALFLTHPIPDWRRAELISLLLKHVEDVPVPGTTHRLGIYIEPVERKPSDIFRPGLRSAFDIDNDRWIVLPERERVIDLQKEMGNLLTYAKTVAAKMKTLILYDPPGAKTYWHQIMERWRRDQTAGKGDYHESNIVYKYLMKHHLSPFLTRNRKPASIDTIGSRLTVGHRPLESAIGVRIPAPEPISENPIEWEAA